MTFDAAAVGDLFDRVLSHVQELGLFDTVNGHSPKSRPPTSGLTAALEVQSIEPVTSSGLASTSGKVSFRLQIFSSLIQQPEDAIDPNILTAAATLMAAYSGDLDLGATVRNIDLLGQYGESLSARAMYGGHSKTTFRIMEVTIPVIINDFWGQA